MPGYVFFDADTEPTWNRILKDSAVLKLLSYGDGEYALRGVMPLQTPLFCAFVEKKRFCAIMCVYT